MALTIGAPHENMRSAFWGGLQNTICVTHMAGSKESGRCERAVCTNVLQNGSLLLKVSKTARRPKARRREEAAAMLPSCEVLAKHHSLVVETTDWEAADQTASWGRC